MGNGNKESSSYIAFMFTMGQSQACGYYAGSFMRSWPPSPGSLPDHSVYIDPGFLEGPFATGQQAEERRKMLQNDEDGFQYFTVNDQDREPLHKVDRRDSMDVLDADPRYDGSILVLKDGTNIEEYRGRLSSPEVGAKYNELVAQHGKINVVFRHKLS
jgi:hypothetical protein